MSDLNKFQDLLREKKTLLQEFLKLTEEQYTAVKNKNYDPIFNLINEKQNIIERVNILDLELKNLPQNIEKDLKDFIKEIKEIIAKAIELDDLNIQKLKENKAEIAQKLKNTRKNKKTHSLYRGKHAAIGGILLDKKK